MRMRITSGRALALALTATFLTGLVSAATADKVFRRQKDGKAKALEGRIVADELRGVVLKSEGADLKVKRDDVVRVVYGGAPPQLEAIKSAMEGENWAEAAGLCARAYRDVKRMDKTQGKLVAQYLYFYWATVDHKMNKYQDAFKKYGQVLRMVPNSIFYFQAKLGEARVLEDAGQEGKAAEKYRLWVIDFGKKKKEFKLTGWATGYIVQAKLGDLRMRIKAAKVAEDQDRLRELDGELEALMRKGGKYLDDDGQGTYKRVKALVWEGLKQWKDLVNFLDREIRENQLADRQSALFGLYQQRADANFEIGDRRGACLDYLRLWLVYGSNLQPPQIGYVNMRTGECFENMFPPSEWKANKVAHIANLKHAKKHYGIAKAFSEEPYVTKAKESLKRIKETLVILEESAEEKPE